jgi:hypothetical protein
MPVVRLLLFLALISIGVALALYLIRRDRRYLRFVWQVVKFTVFMLIAIFVWIAAERLLVTVL